MVDKNNHFAKCISLIDEEIMLEYLNPCMIEALTQYSIPFKRIA